ncbi:TPA: peptidoglycan DD-metalloendopeptidase family protein [Candidatus Gracilibacteria bacterium]|nr:hypothetical protein [Candidatus Peregrinibacteria bacterium]HIQ56851.1 peptidoglycan DD-metalloendopeptidase family protein [Candidatus Gracilibacteria bacterium]
MFFLNIQKTEILHTKSTFIKIWAGLNIALLVFLFTGNSFTFAFSALGTKSEEYAAKQIQEQLTNSYIESSKKAIGIKILEKKILESKVDTLTAEDNIAAYNQDISLIQEKISVFFNQISKPKQKIAELKTKENGLIDILLEQGKILIFVYIQLEEIQNKQKTRSEKLFASFFGDEEIETLESQEIENLKKIEKKIRPKFSDVLFQLQKNKFAQLKIQKSINPIEKQYKKLSEKRDGLEQKKEREEALLTQASSSKNEYDNLLATTRKQMLDSMLDSVRVDVELEALNKKLTELEEKKNSHKKLSAKANAEKMKNLLHGSALPDEIDTTGLSTEDIASIDLQLLKEANESKFVLATALAWPLYPKKGISAGFREPGYYKRFGMQHNAVDIPAPQGTPLTASASGYVYKAKDNGLGYSYIILLHKNNIRTVYGHVSQINVKEGQLVQEGELIGLSGGMPGTKGAGKMTTGPHLHFEVLENGVYKNPLDFLESGVLQ